MVQESQKKMDQQLKLVQQNITKQHVGGIGWYRLALWCSLVIILLAGVLGNGGSSVAAAAKSQMAEKVVYLTFDDGPGKHTPEVLDILRSAQVPATFFVLGEHAKRSPEMIRRIASEGHALGNHTYNHQYKELYKDIRTFWTQIKQTEDIINDIIGIRPALVRAPGGTYGHFDQTYFDLLKQGGYTVMDWNVDSGDSKRTNVPASEIVAQATKAPSGTTSLIVLMHDGGSHASTVKALPDIIEYYKKHNYRFEAMQASDSPVQFQVKPSDKYKSRQAPSRSWIAEHVAPNTQQLLAAKSLKVELGYMTAELTPKEFRLQDQEIMVPLRSYMSKIGGNIAWDQAAGTATTWWKDRVVQVDPVNGTLTSKRLHDQQGRTVHTVIESGEGTIWVPLGELLKQLGAKSYSFQSNDSDWVITVDPPWMSMDFRHFYSMI